MSYTYSSLKSRMIETFRRAQSVTSNSSTTTSRREEMMKKIWLKFPILAALMICLMSISSLAQSSQERSLICDDRWSQSDRPSHCEIREQTLPATKGAINVDGGQNGGVSVKGWDRGDILVRSRVQTQA